VWIFGYGSLVWRPDFPFVERRVVKLEGWSRRFWQGSTDHRGTAQAPGRVATLIEGGECWGAAFRLRERDIEEVLARLDHREQGGYERQEVRIGALQALVYFATSDNPNWLGPAPLREIASTIRNSHGPSGPNLEYLMRLVEALGPRSDSHLRELYRLCVAE
jgi:cation transport protein ChaC